MAIACYSAAEARAALVNLTPAAGSVNSVNSVSLADLQSGQSMGIVVGDKIFTGFSYSRIGDMPSAQDVNVLGFQDTNGNWGVSFHGAFIDLPGGGASDALIRFMVEVDQASQAQGWRISDAHLFVGGAGVGDESVLTVDESFLENNEILNAYVSTIGAGQQAQLSDSAFFDPIVTKLTVTKDIFALAAENAFLPARATVVDQSFSQELIPEPATLVLAGLSAIGMIAVGRKRG
jgi:hypothetical protein